MAHTRGHAMDAPWTRLDGYSMACSWHAKACSWHVGGISHAVLRWTCREHVMVHPMTCHPCTVDVPWTYHGEAMNAHGRTMTMPRSCLMVSHGSYHKHTMFTHGHAMAIPW